MGGKRQTFSREFKLEAVRLLDEGKKPPAELARELGIRRNQLYKGRSAGSGLDIGQKVTLSHNQPKGPPWGEEVLYRSV